MNLTAIVIAILAVCGVVWAYPRLPSPWNYVLVGVVALVCVLVLLNFGNVNFSV